MWCTIDPYQLGGTKKPKAALVKAGILPAGSENKRGRMSAAHIAECERLVRDEGYVIDGFSVSTKPTAATDKPAEPVKVERTKVDPNRIADVPDETRPEDYWDAFTYIDGKRHPVGMRTVCNTCHSSLTYCACRTPIVSVGQDTSKMVSFAPRNTPRPARKW